jgi:hypothetical protein
MKIIRNDDVAADTDIDNLLRFCSICDRYQFKIIQCITPLGTTREIDIEMSDDEIVALGGRTTFLDNPAVIDFLLERTDLIGVHGLWHTHEPSSTDILLATQILQRLGLHPTYFVPPFNEGDYPSQTGNGLRVCAKVDCLENFLDLGIPATEIIYTHSWRFGDWYSWEKLESCLQRIIHTTS